MENLNTNTHIHFANEFSEWLKIDEQQNNQKLKLIIHAGTPKTGTTSIQTYLDKKQRKLRRKGILYPHNLEKLQNPTARKHQWFEKNLVTVHLRYFLENFKNIIADEFYLHNFCAWTNIHFCRKI